MSEDPVDLIGGAVAFARSAGIEFIRTYNRHSVIVDKPLPKSQALIVANHGFGGIIDLNVISLLATMEVLDRRRPFTPLVHQAAWTLGVGRFVEAAGGLKASRANAFAAFEKGHDVAVLPGGDIEAGKPFAQRNDVTFAGRFGFARLAMEAGVPIIPVVTAGAGESLYVISDGRRIAELLKLKRLLRLEALPVSVSFPWGLNVGLVGQLPYVPLPTKLDTAVMPAMTPRKDETAQRYAKRIEATMDARLKQLVEGRRLVIG